MDSFRDKLTVRDVRSALRNLPQGSSVYDVAYHAAMERVFAQGEGSSRMAQKILAWILCAHRPLSTLELLHALAIEPGDTDIDQDNILETEQILTICAGLVTIDEQSDNVRFIHYTTQEYLQRNRQTWLPHAEIEIVRSCTAYLSIDGLAVGPCSSQEDYEQRLKGFALLSYAAVYWGPHWNQLIGTGYVAALDEVTTDALLLLLDSKHLSAISQALFMSERWRWSSAAVREEGEGFSGSHWIARFGLLPLLEQLMDKGHDLEQRDISRRTPLSWAAENGHGATVKQLLDTGKVDVDSKDDYGQTPLSWAARNGEEATVKQLLDTGKVDVDSKDKHGRTPLSHAAQSGNKEGAILLLDKLLTHAVVKETVVQQARHTPIQMTPDCTPDAIGRTPSMWAASEGHISLIQSLWPSHLPTSCSPITRKDNLGLSLIHLFAIGDCAEGISFMLGTGCNVNEQDSQGWTSLHWAAYFGRKEVSCLLLDHGADMNLQDSTGQTAYGISLVVGAEQLKGLLNPPLTQESGTAMVVGQQFDAYCDSCQRVGFRRLLKNYSF
jgi:ankyrin repeat protein